MFNKIRRFIKDPYYSFGGTLIKVCPKMMSSKYYLKTLWYLLYGDTLNLETPTTYTEKLNWLKLYDHSPQYTLLVDKLRVKKWVSETIGDKYVIPTIATFKNTNNIDIENLPNQFVLKCNHDSGSVVICRDKAQFDINEAKQKLKLGYSRNMYWSAREWPYKNVKKVIFAEQYIDDNSTNQDTITAGDKGVLTDYKWLCFNGDPKILYVSHDGMANTTTDFFDKEYNRLPIRIKSPNSSYFYTLPEEVEEMKALAAKLSAGIPHVRVDFYLINKQIYFGEMTFFHDAGLTPVNPTEWNQILGEWIQLPALIRK